MYQNLKPEPEGAIFLKRSKPQGVQSSPHDTVASIAYRLEPNIQGHALRNLGPQSAKPLAPRIARRNGPTGAWFFQNGGTTRRNLHHAIGVGLPARGDRPRPL